MELVKKICGKYFDENEREEKNSVEFRQQSKLCYKLYEELYEVLSAQQKEMLMKLEEEYFLLADTWKREGFNEGVEAGFKFAVKLIFDSVAGE